MLPAFILSASIVSMIYDRKNESVHAGPVASTQRPEVRVEESDERLSRHASGKRLRRIAFLMIDPTLRLVLSFWHRRRTRVVAVVA